MLIQINTESLTQEQLKLLKQGGWMKEESGWYEPKEGDDFYCLTTGWNEYRVFDECNGYDRQILACQQVFRTRAESERADAKRIALTSIQRYIAKNDMEYKVDLYDESKQKYSVMYSLDRNTFVPGLWIGQIPLSHFFFENKTDAEQVIRDCEAELRVLFDLNAK